MEREMNQNNTMSRGEFLKRTAVGAAAAAIAIKFGGAVEAIAAPVQAVKAEPANAGQYVGSIPPVDKTITWIDSSVGGIMKYWDGKEWTPVKSAWG